MIIYRYEKPDGGGPFCTRDGYLRNDSITHFTDDTLSGCKSIEDLNKWFKHQPQFLLKDCKIIKYEGELLYKSNCSTEIIIRKSTAKWLT